MPLAETVNFSSIQVGYMLGNFPASFSSLSEGWSVNCTVQSQHPIRLHACPVTSAGPLEGNS
jgi:hypothetical protein